MPWDVRQRWPRHWTLYFPGSLGVAGAENEVVFPSLPLAANSEDGTTLSLWFRINTLVGGPYKLLSDGASGTNFYITVTATSNNHTVNISHLSSDGLTTNTHSLAFVASNTWQKLTYAFGDGLSRVFAGPTMIEEHDHDGPRPFSNITSLILNANRVLNVNISDLAIYDTFHDEARVARDFPWNIRTGVPGIEDRAIYYWPFDEGERPRRGYTKTVSEYLHDIMDGQAHATIVGSSVAMSNSSHPLWPRYRINLINNASSRYIYNQNSHHTVSNVTQINVQREAASLMRPLGVGRMIFTIDDNINAYKSNVTTWLQVNRAVQMVAEYCGSDHYLFLGDVKRIEDKWVGYSGVQGAGHTNKTVTCDDLVGQLLNVDYAHVVSTTTGYYRYIYDDYHAINMFFETISHTPGCYLKRRVGAGFDASSSELDIINKYWNNFVPAIQSIQKIVEFGNYFAWVSPSSDSFGRMNEIRFEPFSFSQIGTSITSINQFKSLRSYDSYDELINQLNVSVFVIPGGGTSPGSGGGITSPVYIASSTQVLVNIDFVDHVYAKGTNVAGEHYNPGVFVQSQHWITNAQSNGGGADRSATTSFSIAQGHHTKGGFYVKNTNASLGMWLTKFVPPVVTYPVIGKGVIVAASSTSQNSHGVSEVTLDNHLMQTMTRTGSYVTAVLSFYATPKRKVDVFLENHFGYAIRANAGDLISIVNSATDNRDVFFVSSVEHDVALQNGVLVHGLSFTATNYQTVPGGGSPPPPPPPPPDPPPGNNTEWDIYANTGYGATPVSSHYARLISLNTGTTTYVDNTSELNTAVAAASPGDMIMCRAGTYNGTINLNTNGTSAAPIIIRAESTGTWGTRQIRWQAKVNAGGDHLKIAGIKWHWNPGSSNAYVFSGVHAEVFDCDIVDNYMPSNTSRIFVFNEGARDLWLHHCYLSNNRGMLLAFDPSTTTLAPVRPIIEYNNFENSPAGSNGNHCFQYGQYTNGLPNDYAVVMSSTIRYNRFLNQNESNGEIKTSAVRFYRNYNYNCKRTAMRAGANHIFDNNYFKQVDRPIRIFGNNQIVVNNVFDNCFGEASVGLLEGSTLAQCNSNYPNANHVHPQSILIAHNTFYQCQSRSIYIGQTQTGAAQRREPYSPAYLWIYNNVFRLTQGTAIALRTPDTVNTTTTDSYSTSYFAYHMYHQLDIRNNNFYLTGTAVSGRSSGTGRIAWDDATRTTSTTISGTTSADPLLSTTFRITSGSPCVNAGLAFTKNGWNTSSQYDFDANPRLAGSAPDQGHFELA